MPTPTRVFAEVAARHGGVNPEDAEAVHHWYEHILPTLPAREAEAIIEELLAGEGLADDRGAPRRYPDRAATPPLGEASPAREPMLAALWWMLLRGLRPRPASSRDDRP